MPLMPTLSRQRPADLSWTSAWFTEQMQDSQRYAEKPGLTKVKCSCHSNNEHTQGSPRHPKYRTARLSPSRSEGGWILLWTYSKMETRV